jgi:asparagine synthetase B (glutamine-hydrolysing)
MCGIAGVLYADPTRAPDPGVLAAMGRSIAHRGTRPTATPYSFAT